MLEFEVYQKKKILSGKYQIGRRECTNSTVRSFIEKEAGMLGLTTQRTCESNRRMIVKKVRVDLVPNAPILIHSAWNPTRFDRRTARAKKDIMDPYLFCCSTNKPFATNKNNFRNDTNIFEKLNAKRFQNIPNIIQTWFRKHFLPHSEMFQLPPKIITNWFQYDTNIIENWFRNCSKTIPTFPRTPLRIRKLTRAMR